MVVKVKEKFEENRHFKKFILREKSVRYYDKILTEMQQKEFLQKLHWPTF